MRVKALGKRELTNPFAIAQRQLQEACDALGTSPQVYAILSEPQRVMEVAIPVRMDDGSLELFTGYRAQHIDVLGPTKGGVRFHPTVTADEVKGLSLWMTFKTSVLGLPYGGAKGGIIVDPTRLSERELEELSRGYIRALSPILGPERDIPAPDVNTSPTIMGWMLDEFDRLRGYNVPGFITGKPLILGGSVGRLEATGRGVVITIREVLRRMEIPLEGARLAIQGFGNVGSNCAKAAHQLGAKVTAVCDVNGGLYNPDGLDIPALLAYTGEHRTVVGFPGGQAITPEDVLVTECDVLVPAALENVINGMVATRVKTMVVAEAANGPCTLDGAQILRDRGIFVIPDILCNAGGVTVSYFEWVQNMQGYYWSEQEVSQRLEQKMTCAFTNVWDMAQSHGVPMRTAAYMVSVCRLGEALKARGWIKQFKAPPVALLK